MTESRECHPSVFMFIKNHHKSFDLKDHPFPTDIKKIGGSTVFECLLCDESTNYELI